MLRDFLSLCFWLGIKLTLDAVPLLAMPLLKVIRTSAN